MTAAKAAQAADQPKSVANSRADTGALPAKKVAKRPATGARRGAAGSAGARVRRELGKKGDPVGVDLLVRQAARAADRLEALDALLSGAADAWAVLSLPRTDAKRGRIVIEVQVGDTLREERAQAGLYRALVADIAKYRAGQPPAPPTKDEDDDIVD